MEGPHLLAAGFTGVAVGPAGWRRDEPPPSRAVEAAIGGIDACLLLLEGEDADGPLTRGVWRRMLAALRCGREERSQWSTENGAGNPPRPTAFCPPAAVTVERDGEDIGAAAIPAQECCFPRVSLTLADGGETDARTPQKLAGRRQAVPPRGTGSFTRLTARKARKRTRHRRRNLRKRYGARRSVWVYRGFNPQLAAKMAQRYALGHCEVQLQNTYICRAYSPKGTVGPRRPCEYLPVMARPPLLDTG